MWISYYIFAKAVHLPYLYKGYFVAKSLQRMLCSHIFTKGVQLPYLYEGCSVAISLRTQRVFSCHIFTKTWRVFSCHIFTKGVWLLYLTKSVQLWLSDIKLTMSLTIKITAWDNKWRQWINICMKHETAIRKELLYLLSYTVVLYRREMPKN